MIKKIAPRFIFLTAMVMTAFFPNRVFPAYIEGIDTTDANGYGLDSTFKIGTNGMAIGNNGASVINYNSLADCYTGYGGYGFFDYSFNDLKMAPSGSIPYYSCLVFSVYSCFVVRKNDSTYSKVQIINKLSDNRFIYRYGTNSTPKDYMLEKQNYDRSIRYKPNNFHYNFNYPYILALYWDPPLPNNNHLLGYLLYQSKLNFAVVDTSAPINLAQWDTVAITTMDSIMCDYRLVGNPGVQNICISDFKYLNLVAVYAEGNSDFLQGWSYYFNGSVNVEQIPSSSILSSKIKLSANGIHFTLSRSSSINYRIFDISGRELMSRKTSMLGAGTHSIKIASGSFCPGVYILDFRAGDIFFKGKFSITK